MTGDPRLAGAVIVAAGQSPYSKKPYASARELLVGVVSNLTSRLALSPAEIDGLAVSSFQLSPDNVVTVAEHLGLELRWAFQGAHGGASGVVSVIQAAEAVTSGRANVVVCAAADAFDVASHMAMLEGFNTAMRDYLAPYEFGGTNGIFALVEREHRHKYGTTREQLGKIAVTQRQHAQANPNALLRGELTLADYLGARVIADPIRLFDCVMPCTGADAVVVVSLGLAQERDWRSVRILSGEQRHNYAPYEALSLTTGAASFADDLFANAGMSRSELDFLQLYDDYPIMELIQIEDLGFAVKGGGGPFIDQTDLSIRGPLAVNTGGGQLSCGQAGASGGMIGVYEGVAQLLGQANGRQIPEVSAGLISGFGMVGYGRGLSSAAMILTNQPSAS